MIESLLDLFFPPVCPLCEEAIADGPLCPKCLSGFSKQKIDAPYCTVCGIPFLNAPGPLHACGECGKTPRPFKEARSALVYAEGVDSAVKAFKYGGSTILAGSLGHFMHGALSLFSAAPEVIVPVPLHKKRLRKRGFNQSLLLARELNRKLSIELDYLSLRRVRDTEQQTRLAHAEREKNVAGAFEVSDKNRFRDRRVLLVDDVFTTGATILECSRVLKRAGAEVYAITLARAVAP